MAECSGCGNGKAYKTFTRFVEKELVTVCDRCGDFRSSAVPDVYFPGAHKDSNIVDGMGTPILIESKRHKQQLLKERGWVEQGLGRNNRIRV